jgi:protein-S-isoprenylcysteine O-methyltransferase Ste14
MSRLLAEWIWLIGGILWFAIRLPHQRRARKIKIDRSAGGQRDRVLLMCSLGGLAIIPFIYFLIARIDSDPVFADYTFRSWQGWVGLVLMVGAIYLFYETHRQLGRNWSVTLETRKKHTLVDTGLYGYVRHPMYSAFWLLAVAQAFLLANWIAGFSGIVGWGILFFLRVGHEERLMIDTFGREYVDYMNRTKRVVPWVY